jgi:N-acyl-D-amino-acid deacylase
MENKGIGLNEAYLVPHGNIRMAVMGLENRNPSAGEMDRMRLILEREMKAGAFGFSTGLMYMPCIFAQTEELVELCKVVAEFDGVFAVHQRSEANDILQSMKEVLDIGRRSGVKVHFSHFKVCGRKNWRFIGEMLELLDQAQSEGIRVTFDQYPYSFGSTILGALVPPWAHEGGTDKLLERLQQPDLRRQMVHDIEQGIPGWDNFIEFAGLDQIYIAGVASKINQDLVGKNLVEIGQIRDKDPYEAVFDLLYEEKNTVHIVDFFGTEEHVVRLLNRPEQNFCTDGLIGERPHPRIFGSFPRVLGKYVREEKVLSLAAAVRKMTGKPAETFGISRRGFLRENYFADIVVFDPNTIIDKGTFSDPIHYPEGINYVLINGEIVVAKGEYHRQLAGKVLRKSF